MPSDPQVVSQFFTAKQTQLICDPNGGWAPPNFTDNAQWAYASPNSITVPSDATTYYQVGNRIRLKQGGAYLYFYIINVAPTLLTITSGAGTVLANAPITDYEVSGYDNPTGFPSDAGWDPPSSTETAIWTYSSATNITVSSDATTYYQIGAKIRLKQGGAYKYFYIVGVSSTSLQIDAGSVYTLANAAITDYEVSFASSPVGFPDGFLYATVPGGFSSTSTLFGFYFLIGGTCFASVSVSGTSNTTGFSMTMPLLSVNNPVTGLATALHAPVVDNGSIQSIPGRAVLNFNSNMLFFFKDCATSGWTASGTKSINCNIIYQIA